jgi:putative membrane protein
MKQRLSVLKAQFNWRMLLVRWLVYGLVLLLVAFLVPKIYFTDRRVWVWLMVAAAFGVLNAIVRPLLHALMLQLFFASLGLVVALINGFMLYLLSWIFPNRFAVNSILWALLGGILVALLGSFLEGLFGLTRPIVPESEAELRQRLRAQDRSLVYTFLKRGPAPVLASEDEVPEIAGAAPAEARTATEAAQGVVSASPPAEDVEARSPEVSGPPENAATPQDGAEEVEP